MTAMSKALAGTALAAVLVLPLAAGAQNADGTILALSCAACHGTGGASPGAIPSLRGKTAAYIGEALTEFKTGKRSATVMGRLAKGYSDAEIKALADHFASLK
jgi:sulfide dehydrogenase cytochrome subunit